ncbi:MAG: hypothetical protein BWX87_02796 [Bacteroidetes bacterium ADurb.Bin123]|nr:MAG: hypothetical protein BWX87_02796 [Bacteroidetes bacterium ADurb.Bin123]
MPGIGFPEHVSVIRVIWIKIFNPVAVVNFSPPEAGSRVKQILVIACASHEHPVIFLITQFFGYQGCGVVVIGVFHRFGDRCLVFIPGRDICRIFFGNPAPFHVLVQIRPSATPGNCSILQQQLIGPFQVKIFQTPQIGSSDKHRSMIPVKESRHISSSFFSFVGKGLDDVKGYFRRDHPQQYELISVVVPEGGIGVIMESVIDDVVSLVDIILVDIASECRPEEGSVKAGIEDSFFPLGSPCHLNF